MIPFPFNENRFSFFVADHLLDGQLYTNPKGDRSLLSCLKVAQCSTSEIIDAPLYNHALYWSKLWQQYHCQHPQNANLDCHEYQGRAQGRAPSSPDLNLLDYFVLSYVENITNMTSHNTKASLITTIRRVFAELPPALVEKVCSQFPIRIEAVIEAEGGYIE